MNDDADNARIARQALAPLAQPGELVRMVAMPRVRCQLVPPLVVIPNTEGAAFEVRTVTIASDAGTLYHAEIVENVIEPLDIPAGAAVVLLLENTGPVASAVAVGIFAMANGVKRAMGFLREVDQ